jgi:murein DD-endopeptidase MepM/ murein hydrolase activator NlpD
VIHDYKFKAPYSGRRRRRGLPWLVGCGVLIAAFGIVRFVDVGSSPSPAYAPIPTPAPVADKVVDSLALPPKPATTTSLPPTSAPAEPSMTQPVETTPAVAVPATVATAPSLLAPTKPAPPAVSVTVPEPSEATPPAQTQPAVDLHAETEPETADTTSWLEHRIASGDSLARIFSQYDLDKRVLHGIVNSSEDAKTLADIRPGQTLRLRLDESKTLTRLELQRSPVETLRVSIQADDYEFERLNKSVERRVTTAAGLIESSLFVDGQRAGLSDRLIMEMAGIFGWDIDFALEIRAGDEFRVVFEEQYLDGEKLRDGPILAAEFINRGHTYRAIRYETVDGEVGYFDDEGRSKRRAFIRTPIKFARISSGFNPKRWHPVLQRWRSHKGVDYAAPTGTPIKASGDGKVVFRGTKGGYGKTIILQHAGKYTTLYAHMSRYARRTSAGARVEQGQVIGYVGQSGMATGPHLHYEFRVDGVHKDPLKVKLPKSLALPKSEIARFQQTAEPLLAQLDAIRPATMVASAEAGEDRP